MPPELDPLSELTAPRSPRASIDALITKHSDRTGLDPDLVRRLVGQESGGNSRAVSPKGAGGVMQLMPATAASLGVKNRFDPDENIRAGTDYLKQQLDKFGDVNLALAAYNAGPGAVEKYGNKVPPYAETQNYVKRIAGGYQGTGYAQDPLTALTRNPSQDPLTELTQPSQPVVPRSRQPRPPKIINPNDLNAQLLSALQKAQGPAVEAGAKVGQPSVAQETRGGLRGLAQMAGAPTGYMGDVGDWVNEAVYQGTARLLRGAAGAVKQLPHDPFEQNQVLKDTAKPLQQAAANIEARTPALQSDRGKVSKFTQGLVAGGIGSSPAMVLSSLGVPAPIAFGLQSELEASGRDEDFKNIVKDTAKGATIGALFELPLPAKQELLSSLQQRLLRAGIVGGGTAAITGSPQEAIVNAAFAASGGTKVGEPELTQTVPESLQARLRMGEVKDAAAAQGAELLNPAEVVAGAKPKVRVAPEAAVRHVDLQPRDEAGQFREETPLETETRRAQVASPVSQPAAETITSPPPATVAPIAEPSTSLPPTTPEMGTPKLARGVEAKAVQAKLTQSFEGLPEYQKVNVADQAQRAVDLLRNDPQRARDIAMGRDMPDGDLTPEAVFTAVENHALKNGDVDTLRDLATASTRPLEATVMGQRIRLLAERNPTSAVSAIRDVEIARQSRAQKQFGKNGEGKIKSDIQMEVRKAAPKAKDWSSFLDSIRC